MYGAFIDVAKNDEDDHYHKVHPRITFGRKLGSALLTVNVEQLFYSFGVKGKNLMSWCLG